MSNANYTLRIRARFILRHSWSSAKINHGYIWRPSLTHHQIFQREAPMKRIVVFGGAGFIGSNLSKNLLDDGNHVTVFDSLARRGSELNIEWLRDLYDDTRLDFIKADTRDA